MIDLDKNHILLIDDSEIDRARMSFLLKSENNIIYPSETVNKAISLLDKHEFSLAICDIQMPDKDGFEFARTEFNLSKYDTKSISAVKTQENNTHELILCFDDKYSSLDISALVIGSHIFCVVLNLQYTYAVVFPFKNFRIILLLRNP